MIKPTSKVLVTNDSDNLKEHFVDAFASLKAAFKIQCTIG